MPRDAAANHSVRTYTLDSFEALCFDKTPSGAPYREAIKRHTVDLATAYMADHPDMLARSPVAVVGVPRGGLATAEGLREIFSLKARHPGQVVLAESRIKQQAGSLYPEGLFERSSTLVIADGIIATGKTIIDHLRQVPPAWKGVVTVFANAAARMGIENIAQQAEQMPQDVKSAFGRVFEDSECKWVDLAGKKVYFVGMDCNIPDFGDHIAPSVPAPRR